MTTHLYCVLPHQFRGAIPLGLSGVAGARVRALPVAGLVAWVSDAERSVSTSIEGIRAHHDVVEAALETGSTPVPARYGQRFDDDDACRAALASRSPWVERLIETMQGFVEMTILITPSTSRMVRDLEPVIPEMLDVKTAGVGRRYLDTLRKREARSGEISEATDEIARRLNDVASQYIERTLSHHTITPMPLRTISHLVRRDNVAAFREAIGQVANAGDYRFLVIGPRAPYSFCALNTDSGGPHGMTLAD
jgi:hypothetical protein